MTLAEHAAYGCRHAVVFVHDRSAAGLVNSESGVECEGEVLEEFHFCEASAVECVALSIVLVENCSLKGVRCSEIWTYKTSVLTVTIVVHLQAVFVNLDVALAVSDVDRIDRRDTSCDGEDVAG